MAAEYETFLNVPDKHARTLLPAPVLPASARQFFRDVEPGGAVLFTGQSEHASELAETSLYFPAAHSTTLLPKPL